MSISPSRYCTAEEVAALIQQGQAHYARVDNPPYIKPAYEYIPLLPNVLKLEHGIRAVFMDMDGTTTMTEDLCLHALETFVRKATGKYGSDDWAGLNPEQDYPHIIGSSVTANVGYLIQAYGKEFQKPRLDQAFIAATAWTLGHRPGTDRVRETKSDLLAVGGAGILEDPRYTALVEMDSPQSEHATELATHYGPFLDWSIPENRVRCGLAIYYESLHAMLLHIEQGHSASVADKIYKDGRAHAIVPLNGVGLLHALVQGWLGEDTAAVAQWHSVKHQCPMTLTVEHLNKLGQYFEAHPTPVALVTSSTAFEAHVVLNEVFSGLIDEVAQWPLSEEKRACIQAGFKDHNTFYAAVITASDCHEIRLKPYRDLYNVGLHALGILPDEAINVVGFEDTESGVIALRAAGVGIPCAVPFEGTAGHDFQAASHIQAEGVLGAVLQQGLFMDESALQIS